MTRDEAVGAVLEELQPSLRDGGRLRAYAILDGARDPRIEKLIVTWGLEHTCLHGEEIAPELRSAGAFLARLRDDGEAGVVLNAGWGNAWGVFVEAPAEVPFRQIERHFRRHLRILDDGGRMLLFRFYDPRVLQTFLPTCDEQQHAEFFGPAERMIVESGLRMSLFPRRLAR